MRKNRTTLYLMIVIGSILIIYTQNSVADNWFWLIPGIILLMAGIGGLSRGIASHPDREESYIITEEEE